MHERRSGSKRVRGARGCGLIGRFAPERPQVRVCPLDGRDRGLRPGIPDKAKSAGLPLRRFYPLLEGAPPATHSSIDKLCHRFMTTKRRHCTVWPHLRCRDRKLRKRRGRNCRPGPQHSPPRILPDRVEGLFVVSLQTPSENTCGTPGCGLSGVSRFRPA